MKNIYRFITFLFAFLLCTTVHAQEKSDLMRSNGRIYVVIAVILTILAGLILYLIRLDRKIAKLEKEANS
jgi:hypothetical protein